MNLACVFSSVDIFLAFCLFKNFNFYILQLLQITSARVEGISDLDLCMGMCNHSFYPSTGTSLSGLRLDVQ